MARSKPNILLSVSGSVAAIKILQLYEILQSFAHVRIVATESAMHFIRQVDLYEQLPLYQDKDEWEGWSHIGDEVLHIELRKWADINIVAPVSANTLAKIANGICDNLLTCIIRAWDFKKPLVLAPAMNTLMWENPFTEKHISTCRSLGMHMVPPVSKRLACGDVGTGGMASPEAIVEYCRTFL